MPAVVSQIPLAKNVIAKGLRLFLFIPRRFFDPIGIFIFLLADPAASGKCARGFNSIPANSPPLNAAKAAPLFVSIRWLCCG